MQCNVIHGQNKSDHNIPHTCLLKEYISLLSFSGMSEMMKSIRILILLMCHYPEVQSRVQTEIDDVIGKNASPSSNHRPEMPYTQAVLLEMLRYVSQTPLAIPHKCNKDVILDGYLIEKDAGVSDRSLRIFIYHLLMMVISQVNHGTHEIYRSFVRLTVAETYCLDCLVCCCQYARVVVVNLTRQDNTNTKQNNMHTQ